VTVLFRWSFDECKLVSSGAVCVALSGAAELSMLNCQLALAGGGGGDGEDFACQEKNKLERGREGHNLAGCAVDLRGTSELKLDRY